MIRTCYNKFKLRFIQIVLFLTEILELHYYLLDKYRCVDFYEIIENKRLGKGSYGSVYLCKHRKTGDEFACKVRKSLTAYTA